jgi:hypothetical protein
MVGDRQRVRQRRERQLAPPCYQQITYHPRTRCDDVCLDAWLSILTTLTGESFIM